MCFFLKIYSNKKKINKFCGLKFILYPEYFEIFNYVSYFHLEKPGSLKKRSISVKKKNKLYKNQYIYRFFGI